MFDKECSIRTSDKECSIRTSDKERSNSKIRNETRNLSKFRQTSGWCIEKISMLKQSSRGLRKFADRVGSFEWPN